MTVPWRWGHERRGRPGRAARLTFSLLLADMTVRRRARSDHVRGRVCRAAAALRASQSADTRRRQAANA